MSPRHGLVLGLALALGLVLVLGQGVLCMRGPPSTVLMTIAGPAQGEGQAVQIVSYSGYVRFVAKPWTTAVMTCNCTVECFSARKHNTVEVLVENRTVAATNFTGFYWSYDLLLPEKRKVDVVVILNNVRYVFNLLLTKKAPSPEELELLVKMIRLTAEELERIKWEAVGKASLGWVIATALGYLVARWWKRTHVEEW